MAKTSPTQRTLKLLRDKGYRCEIVEHWNAFAGRRIDLLGFIDIVALDEYRERIIGVQCTTGAHHSERRDKIECSVAANSWRAAGGHIWIISWRKAKPRGEKVARWEPRIEEL